ncbi:hypothetical protein [Streptomyces sp. NRRL F-5630]|uniref:hypothetical protein n=1 Tax=Streptomyces sp. NRRL F-5630 TaxID=1463864 RepID=UPI0004CBC1E7|nr:hypothetical protein [Streptomyces sp. NRRL F-5630]
MERIKVTADEVMSTLRAVVAERPDYVYARPEADNRAAACLYVHHDDGTAKPGCLVGTVLHRLGVPLVELAKWEGEGACSMVPSVTNLEWEDTSTLALQTAQEAQDAGVTWAEALAAAEDAFARS